MKRKRIISDRNITHCQRKRIIISRLEYPHTPFYSNPRTSKPTNHRKQGQTTPAVMNFNNCLQNSYHELEVNV